MDYCPPKALCLERKFLAVTHVQCMYNPAGATPPEQLRLDCRGCHLVPPLVKHVEQSANPARNETKRREENLAFRTASAFQLLSGLWQGSK